MPFTFRVVFGGLCGFVPNTNGHQMRVLVVGAHERTACNGETVLPTHVPLFLFDSRNRRAQIGRKPWESGRLLEAVAIREERFRNGQFCGHQLDREELRFRNEDGGRFGQAFSVRTGRPSSAPANGDAEDLFWVPQMDHAFPGAGRIAPECLGPTPPSSVAARVSLTEGLVSTASLARDHSGPKKKTPAAPSLYVFREFDPPRRARARKGVPATRSESADLLHRRATSPHGARPLATGVQLEIDVPGDMVTVWSSRFDRPNESRWAVGLAPAPGTRVVEAYVYNVSSRPLDLVPEIDKDFEFFYDLCAIPWELPRPRPVPHPVAAGTRLHRPGSTTCSPAMFLAHAEA